jgi:hypothetical protein
MSLPISSSLEEGSLVRVMRMTSWSISNCWLENFPDIVKESHTCFTRRSSSFRRAMASFRFSLLSFVVFPSNSPNDLNGSPSSITRHSNMPKLYMSVHFAPSSLKYAPRMHSGACQGRLPPKIIFSAVCVEMPKSVSLQI